LVKKQKLVNNLSKGRHKGRIFAENRRKKKINKKFDRWKDYYLFIRKREIKYSQKGIILFMEMNKIERVLLIRAKA
jgi:hypothetical protein